MQYTTSPFIIPVADNLLTQHPQLKHLSHALALKYAHNELVTEVDLQKVGRLLWQALAIDDMYQSHCASKGRRICPIIISSQNAAIQQLPWETLYQPDKGFLGKQRGFTLSRHLPETQADNIPLETGPLRVLLFTSMSEDQARLDVEQEQAQLQEALMPWISAGTVQLQMPDDGRFSSFQQQLDQFSPHLVFLSGHGRFYKKMFHSHLEEDDAVFCFEAETGLGSHEVNGKDLAHCFVGTAVQCVVLSACQSGQNSSEQLSTGLMQSLALFGIPHVIGMRESILDIAGIQFSRAFCDQIAQKNRVDIALQTARAAITHPLQGHLKEHFSDKILDTERSLGQWCLPLLISQNPDLPLIDWNFSGTPETYIPAMTYLCNIPVAAYFIGRRKELRQLESRLALKQQQQLLITGVGGQGKTTLAARLAQKLQQQGWTIIDWTLRAEKSEDKKSWSDFRLFMDLQLWQSDLIETEITRIEKIVHLQRSEIDKAKTILQALAQQAKQKLLIIFDNLESIQNPATLALEEQSTQSHFSVWIQAAQQLAAQGVSIIVTSRWKLPQWSASHQLALEHCSYNDYLAMIRHRPALYDLLEQRDQLRHIHKILHGNARALIFFANAIQDSDQYDQAALLASLQNASVESQIDMAIAFVIKHRSVEELALLQRITVYQTPVPIEGIIKLALVYTGELEKLSQARKLVDQLCNVALLETHQSHDLNCLEYQCPSQIKAYLIQQNLVSTSMDLFGAAAEYQSDLFQQERSTLTQAIEAHSALKLAQQYDQADRFALDFIIGALNRQGTYRVALESQWLPSIAKSKYKKIQGAALGLIGKQLLHLSDYKTALDYLQQSLMIRQEIGDKSGQGTTLHNISQIFKARGDYKTALDYLQQSLLIRQEIGDKSGEGTTLNNISQIFKARGDYEAALDYLQQSLAIAQEIGDKSGKGTTLNNMATIAHARGDYETALDYLQQSLMIQQAIGDKSGEGATLNNMATTAHARGDYETALDYLQQSLMIRQAIGDKLGEGITLNNMATIAHARGDYETALDYLQQSLMIQQAIGDKSGEGATLNNMATTVHARGDYKTALDYLQQSLTIVQEIGDKSVEGTTLNNISKIYFSRGNYKTVLDYLQQSLMIQQKIGDKLGEGTTLNNISQIYDSRGDYKTALDYLQQSLLIQQEIGDNAGMCVTLFNIGNIYLENQQSDAAIATWVNVYQLAKPMQLAQVLDALEKLAESLGSEEGLEFWERLAQNAKLDPST